MSIVIGEKKKTSYILPVLLGTLLLLFRQAGASLLDYEKPHGS